MFTSVQKSFTPAQHHLHQWHPFAYRSIKCSDLVWKISLVEMQIFAHLHFVAENSSAASIQATLCQTLFLFDFLCKLWSTNFFSVFSACHTLLFSERLSLWGQSRLAADHTHFICHCWRVSRSRSNPSVYFSHKKNTSSSCERLHVQFKVFLSHFVTSLYVSRKPFSSCVINLQEQQKEWSSSSQVLLFPFYVRPDLKIWGCKMHR